MTTRRTILMTGAAAAIIAGGGWALTRAPKQARAPWRNAAEGFGDGRLDALAYAILAPNPHNMQPWVIELVGEDALLVRCDLTRLLPETDPPNRQITVGFGCFLELLSMAAAEKGLAAEIEYFPEGEPWPNLDNRPVARVRLNPDPIARRDPLFQETLTRRTNRAPFDMDQPVDSATLDQIAAAASTGVKVGVANDAARLETLRALTVEAWRTEWNLARTRRESIKVTRIGKREINAEPWGLALVGAPIEALNAAGVLTRDGMDTAGTTAYKQSIAFYEDACNTAMAFAWMTTDANSRADQLNAGRALVRMQLAANAAGVGFHPLSQALQEFPEMAAHYNQAHALLAPEGGVVQMLMRLGYANAPPPAPREPLQSKLINA